MLRASGVVALLATAGCGSAARSPYALDYGYPVSIDVPVARHRLSNGLEVLLHEDHGVPLVAVNVLYHAGAKDEPKGRSGLAHLVEHLSFTGTLHAPEGAHFELLQRAGARDVNGSTTVDWTSYVETVPKGALDLALWLEEERMAFFGTTLEATFERERNVVKNERRQRYENAPGGMVRVFVNAATFPEGHPYHTPAIGDEREIDAATLEEARAFHGTYYVPSNATLVLAGDFDARTALASVERTLGAVAPRPQPALRDTPTPVKLAGETRLVIEAAVDRPSVVVAWPVVPRFAPGWTELEVGTDSLEGAVAYGLMKEESLAERVDVNIEGRQLASLFTIEATLKPGASPEKALAQIHRWVDLARATSFRFDRTIFAIRRARLIMGGVYELEALDDRASQLNLYNHFTGSPDFAKTELLARRNVLVEDIRDAFYDQLPLDRRVVAFVLPNEQAPRAGRMVKGAR
jgi:predicted Zn-dependent peptidase